MKQPVNDRVTSMYEAPHVPDDAALLDLYCQTRSADAFTTLVQRHIGWVNALARRKVKDLHLAEDVTQAVFIILARKASSIGRDTPLSAWLFRVARFAANDAVKQESRRRGRLNRLAEARAADQSGKPGPETDLDEAIACLSDSDRQAILLRFYEDKSMAEIGQTLGINEVAAKKRVSRALRRLRELMARRGAPAMSIAMLALLLLRGTRAAKAAGAELAQTVSRSAGGLTDASGASVRLADAALKRLAGAQSRLLAALAGASLVLVLGVSSISPVMGQIVGPWIEAVQSLFAPATVSTELPEASAPPVARKEAPPIARAWAGRGGDLGWPIYPSGGTNGPIRIDSPSGINSPVVVVQDSRGRVWYRPVDADHLPTPAAVAARADYEDLNPYATSQALEEMIARDAVHFRDAADSADGSWRLIDRVGDDGSIVLPEFEIEYFVDGTPFGDSGSIEQIIPEPTAILAGAAFAGMLRRRRRRP
jgi:RNA polymerase sigma factor (sigma-70 family)